MSDTPTVSRSPDKAGRKAAPPSGQSVSGTDAGSAGRRWPRYAAGAAVGSAAIAAALLYYNRAKAD